MRALTAPRKVRWAGKAAGFTLIEVSLSLLVVGLGLLAIFSLFPSGLRSAEEGAADTRAGLFAGLVLNGLHGNAAAITNWDDWCSGGVSGALLSGISTPPLEGSGQTNPIPFPPESGNFIRYSLMLNTSSPNRYRAYLQVWDGEYGSYAFPATFYTELVYQGM